MKTKISSRRNAPASMTAVRQLARTFALAAPLAATRIAAALMTPRLWLAPMLVLGPVLLWPSCATAQSLPAMARSMSQTDPKVAAARALAGGAQADLDQTAASYGGRVVLYADAARTARTESGTQGSDAGVRLRYPVYTGGRRQADTDRARARIDSAHADAEIRLYEQWNLLALHYSEWLKLSGQARITREHLAQIALLRDASETIFRIDQGRRVDLDQVRLRHTQASLRLDQQESAAAEAALRLASLTGATTVAPVVPLPGEFAMGATISSNKNQVDSHPLMRAAIAGADAARHGVRMAGSQASAQINLIASQSSRTSQGQFHGGQGVSDLRLQWEWEAFDAGLAAARSRGAALQETAAHQQILAAARELRNEEAQLESRMSSLRSRTALLAKQVEAARGVGNDFEEQFRFGRRGMSDLLNAKTDLYFVQLAQNDEQHELLLNELKNFILSGEARRRWLDASTMQAGNQPTSR